MDRQKILVQAKALYHPSFGAASPMSSLKWQQKAELREELAFEQ